MNIEVMEKKLYDACLEGDVEMLKELMREDGLTLAQVSISSCFNQTPLHLASMLGHFEFAESLLSYKPDFASRLDSQERSPLHVASANGYANIVRLLLEYDQDMCRVHDEDGRTPLHLAVMNGQHESVIELMKVNSESFDGEETVFHLCVMYNRLNLLIHLLKVNKQDLSNIKDGNGNTILHSAAALKRMQIIKYLVLSRSEVDVDVVNKNGLTALDIVEQMPKDVKTMEIKELLISASTLRDKKIKGAATASSLLIPGVGSHALPSQPIGSSVNPGVSGGVADNNIDGAAGNSTLKKMWKQVKNFTIFQEKKENRDETLLLAATVIAAMAYQAAISPPGGIAGIDAIEVTKNSIAPYYKAFSPYPAVSLLAYFYPTLSNAFWILNTISFLASLSVIFIFVSGATLKRRFFIWLIRAAMWITLSSVTLAYACAVQATTPKNDDGDMNNDTLVAIKLALLTWIGFISVSFFVLIYRSIRFIVRKKRKRNTREAAAAFRTPNANTV